MTKLALLGAAAVVLTSTLAGPAMAQPVISNPGRCAQFYPDANCQNYGPGNPYTDGYQQRTYRRTVTRDATPTGTTAGMTAGTTTAGIAVIPASGRAMSPQAS
jgi:hypothetical protein